VSLSSILAYIGMVLAILAATFFLIGALRTRLSIQSSRVGESLSKEFDRQKIIRRADWRCAASLLSIAFLSLALSLIGRPFFTERSGNIAGGAVLIAAIVAFLLAIVLIIRYVDLSRALRRSDESS